MISRFDFLDALRKLRREEGATPARMARFPIILEALGTKYPRQAIVLLRNVIEKMPEGDERRIAIENVYGFGDAPINVTADDRRNWLIGKSGETAKLAMSFRTLLNRESAAIDFIEHEILGEVDTSELDLSSLVEVMDDAEAVQEGMKSTSFVRSNLDNPALSDREFRVKTSEYIDELSKIAELVGNTVPGLAERYVQLESNRLKTTYVLINTLLLSVKQGDSIAMMSAMLRDLAPDSDELEKLAASIEECRGLINTTHQFVSEHLKEKRDGGDS